jgi:hypothetical protein
VTALIVGGFIILALYAVAIVGAVLVILRS